MNFKFIFFTLNIILLAKFSTFARMIFSRQHIQNCRSLIASLLLGLFLLSNYGVNFAGIHQHSEYHKEVQNTELKTGKIHQHDCLACCFQNLVYEPLTQNYFEFERVFETEHQPPVKPHHYTYSLSEYYSSIRQRGPPAFFI